MSPTAMTLIHRLVRALPLLAALCVSAWARAGAPELLTPGIFSRCQIVETRVTRIPP
jgi:hypothetical protein